MKKIKLLILALTATLAACKRDNFNELKPVAITIDIAFDATAKPYNFPVKNSKIILTNLTNGNIVEGKTDENGTLNLTSVSPGNYDIEATLSISPADYFIATGTMPEVDVVFNAVLKSQSVIQEKNHLSLELKAGKLGDWIIKQIYYAGSHTSNGAMFRDQFIEVYNNSNEVLYADSLCFSQVFGTNTKLTAIDMTKGYYQVTTKQFDWTKSIGMIDSKANTDYVYAKSLFMIPGTGTEHPVQPGNSIIIAATALNHKSPFTGADGKTISVKDPSLTIDLSNADFEVYLGNYPGVNPLASDVDNPAVTNLTVLSRGGNRDLIMDATGRDAYVVFKAPSNVANWAKYPAPDETVIGTSTDLYTQIPIKYISDGVEIETPLDANRLPKKLGAALDAGAVFVSKGQYSSQSLIRKTAKTINGRNVLSDSNNSKNDFAELNIPDVTKTVFK